MTPRLRKAAFAMAVLLVAAGWAWDAGLLRFLRPPPTLEVTPAALALGQSVLERRCLPCHSMIPLEPRVRGWSALRAYEAIGDLPKLRAAMPPFGGTDEERRALAVYLEALGADRGGSP